MVRQRNSSTVLEENDLSLLYQYGYLRLLNIDTKKWHLDRRSQDPSIHRRWHPTFHLEMGALRPPVVTFAERVGSLWRLGLSPRLFPFWAFFAEVPLLFTMVVSSGHRPQSGWAPSESCGEVIVSFTLFFLFNNVPVTVYRHG
jgi:hypothetical protein